MASIKVFFKLKDTDDTECVEFTPTSNNSDIKSRFKNAANIQTSEEKVVLKLYDKSGFLITFGSVAANTPNDAYILHCITNEDTKVHQTTQEVLAEINSLAEHVLALKPPKSSAITSLETPADKLMNKPAIKRIQEVVTSPLNIAKLKNQLQGFIVKPDLNQTSFDIWNSDEDQIILTLRAIFVQLRLLEAFKISDDTLFSFLRFVQILYNRNPFHNFRHCLCVTQMVSLQLILQMYSMIEASKITSKLSNVEKLTLVVSCIGHDLDHPGYNNAYQINAGTELAIIYNDTSPLENHHAAVLFALLKLPEANILKFLTDNEQKEFRRDCVACILATDMAKHGEITGKFKAVADAFKFEDEAQRKLLMQMIIKCSDISNEVRPQKISEPWVDSLLEEFFSQSDREKAEGLPTAPFMDRQKVTKSSAQGMLCV